MQCGNRAAAIHGALLNRPDRWRARLELSEAEPRKSFARVPNGRQSDCTGIATDSGVSGPSESSGSSCASAKYGRAKYARTERANGDSAAECCRHWQAQPGAIEKRSAILRRRLQDPLRRNSTGRLSLDCLSEA
jgi:hypothetical protein